jgi:hypothetical protein
MKYIYLDNDIYIDKRRILLLYIKKYYQRNIEFFLLRMINPITNSNQNTTLEVVAQLFSVTKERVRQVTMRMSVILGDVLKELDIDANEFTYMIKSSGAEVFSEYDWGIKFEKPVMKKVPK